MSRPGIRGKCLKIQFFLKRKPGMSPEEFHQYWEGDHALFALRIPGFKSVAASYTQFHTTPQLLEKASLFGLPALEFDGVAEMRVESVEDYVNHMSHDSLAKMMQDEESKFLGPGSQILIGYEKFVHSETDQSRESTA